MSEASLAWFILVIQVPTSTSVTSSVVDGTWPLESPPVVAKDPVILDDPIIKPSWGRQTQRRGVSHSQSSTDPEVGAPKSCVCELSLEDGHVQRIPYADTFIDS